MADMDGLDGMEDEATEEDPRFVKDRQGRILSHYVPLLYTTPLGVKIQCIAVAEVDDKILMAFPHRVWNRQVAKRVIPPGTLSRPTLVEVACCAVEARDELVDEVVMKIWVGYVTAETFATIEDLEEGGTLDNRFVTTSGSEDYLPFAVSLSDALAEHFVFLSAESGATDGPGRGGSGSQDLATRVSSLEDLLGKVSQNLENLASGLQAQAQDPQPLKTGPRVKFQDPPARKGPRSATTTSKFPSLDQSVVSAALAAGIPESNLEEMQKLMMAGQKTSKKLREPALRKTKVSPVAVALSESEDENVSEVEAEDAGLAGSSSPPSMEAAVGKLTELVSLLAADRVKKARGSKMELALENLGASTTAESSGSGSVKRAAAARRALRQGLQEAPEEISGVVERMLLEDLTSQTQAPGMPMASFNARAWVEHRSRIGSAYKTSAYAAWSTAGILDNLVKGKVAHARAQAGLLLLQLDQVAIDRGNWSLASELSLEQGPPLASLSSHALPTIADRESPYSRLLDPRWCEVMLSHLRDAEDYVSKRRSLGKKTGGDEPAGGGDGQPKSRPKAKAKAKAHNEPTDNWEKLAIAALERSLR